MRSWNALGDLYRAGPALGILETAAERHYDRVFASCLDVIESLLRESHRIEEDSKLKLLSEPGNQVAHIDLLLAEVGPGGDEEFRRLIVVEAKLAANHESRRKILSQVLDYSRIVQTELMPEDLPDAVSDWVDEHRDDIHRSMRTGNFLLIVCGDTIHESLVKLLHHYTERLDPSSLTDLVLIALPVYSSGEMHVLVPDVVGATDRATRDLTVRVEVHAADGMPLHVGAVRVEDTPRETTGPRERLVDPEAFMSHWETMCGREAADAWRAFVATAQHAAIPELYVGNYAGGAPYVYLENPAIGSVQVVRLSDRSPEVRDRLSGKIWDTNAGLHAARSKFRSALLQLIPGAAIKGRANRVYAPVQALATAKDPVVAAISTFSTDLVAATTGSTNPISGV